MKKAAISTWLPVACVGRMEAGDVAKCWTVQAVLKAEVCATFMVVEDVVNEKGAGPVPRKVASALHTAEDIAVK